MAKRKKIKRTIKKKDSEKLKPKQTTKAPTIDNEEMIERPLPSDQIAKEEHQIKKENNKKKNKNVEPESFKVSILERIEINQEKDYFIENLTILFSSGLNVVDSLDSIKAGLKTPSMKKLVEFVKNDIASGEPVWKTLEKTQIFPKHIISLIKIGEESGRLPENLGLIVTQQQRERMFSSRIKTAMMYPVMVLVLTVVLGVGISWFVLPKMTSIFGSMDMELPWITRTMLAIADFMEQYGIIVAPAILITFGSILYVIFFNKKTKHIGQSILLKTPVIKRLIQETEISRFGYVFGSLLDAGLPILNTLDSLKDSTDFHIYKQLYENMGNNITEGISIQQCLLDFKNSQKLIPAPIQHMIMASEKSGSLAGTLLSVGKTYEEKLENTTKSLTTLLEPLLLVVVWGGVLLVALSVILPLYSMIGGMNQDPTTMESESNNMGPKETPVTPAEEPSDVVVETEDDLPELKIVESTNTTEELSTENNTDGPLTESIQIRDYPSQNGEIVGTVEIGEIYHFRNQSNSWFEIIVADDTYGWIEDNHIEIIE